MTTLELAAPVELEHLALERGDVIDEGIEGGGDTSDLYPDTTKAPLGSAARVAGPPGIAPGGARAPRRRAAVGALRQPPVPDPKILRRAHAGVQRALFSVWCEEGQENSARFRVSSPA